MNKQDVLDIWLDAIAKARKEGDVRWAVYCKQQAMLLLM